MELNILNNPKGSIPPRIEDFLESLAGPTIIHLSGLDASRVRVLVTLSHGNEPSGLRAIHRWMQEKTRPSVDIVIILGAVKAALTDPIFYYRHLPSQRDLNRCFSPPYPSQDPQGQLAKKIVEHIRSLKPEAVVDMHNTSGSSRPFAVTCSDDSQHLALAGLFVDTVLMTRLRVGSLMEQELGSPLVTIEVGGSKNPDSARVAWEGVQRYFLDQNLYTPKDTPTLLNNPLRLEICSQCRIDYAAAALEQFDLTVREDIEKFNFTPIDTNEMIGWMGDEELTHIQVLKEGQISSPKEFFEVREGKIYPKCPMQLFMATTRADIAATDCLFYFIPESKES